jgi:hypothetical protein
MSEPEVTSERSEDRPVNDEDADAAQPGGGPRFGRWMGSMWLYTSLRFGLFFVLWGILYLLGVRGFTGPLVALVLSVPLSFVLLARPRANFTRQLELRIEARREERSHLDAELDPDADKRDED